MKKLLSIYWNFKIKRNVKRLFNNFPDNQWRVTKVYIYYGDSFIEVEFQFMGINDGQPPPSGKYIIFKPRAIDELINIYRRLNGINDEADM